MVAVVAEVVAAGVEVVAEAEAEEDCRPLFLVLLLPLPLPLVFVVVIVRRRGRGRALGLAVHLVHEGVGLRHELGRERSRNASVVDLGLRLSAQLVGLPRSGAHVAVVEQARDLVAAVGELGRGRTLDLRAGVALLSPPSPPQPPRASASALQTVSQAFGQSFGKVPFTYLSLCALDRVWDPPKLSALRVEVDHQIGRPRVAVARLADRTWIE